MTVGVVPKSVGTHPAGAGYRREVDGLRAVAVVPVILFHAGFEIFSGGFVGVDVFFVISGYLITGILLKELSEGRFSLWRFYERRARRILPSLFFVMAVTVPFAWIWMLPAEFADYTKSIIAVVLFVSNILFWRESGYFEPAAELKPLLHTWSLAVEEQYYVLFPLFLMVAWRYGPRKLFGMILVMALVSLAISHWGATNKPVANFYLAPSRAWELLAGSLAAFWVHSSGRQDNQWLSLIGLALIIFAIFGFDGDTPFPSLWTLVPVGGTALILLFGGQTTWAGKLLSLKGFVWIGLVSYSAYLWHQPLFAFARIKTFEAPPEWLMLLLAVASLGLAWFSWRFVEQPFRGNPAPFLPRQRPLLATAFAGIVGFAIFGLLADNTRYFKSATSETAQRYLAFLDYAGTPEHSELFYKGCFLSSNQDDWRFFDKEICLETSEEKPNILYVGDSHAAHLWGALSDAMPSVNLMRATASGCRPLLPATGPARCTDMVEYTFKEVLAKETIDTVILGGQWLDEDPAKLAGTIAHLQKHVDRVVVIGPTVLYSTDMPRILGGFADLPASERQAATLSYLEPERFEMSERIAEAVYGTGATFIPLIDAFCPNGVCPVLSDAGDPIIFDRAHFSLSGSKTMARILSEKGYLDLILEGQ